MVPVSFHKQPGGGSEVCASSQKQSTVWGIARPGGEPADQGQTNLSMTEERKREGGKRVEGQLWEGRWEVKAGQEMRRREKKKGTEK